MRWHTLMMVLTAGLLIAAGGPQDDAAKKELKTFQGTWVLVSAVTDGKTPSDEKGIKLIITGIKYSLTQESSAVIGHRGTFSLDPAKKPKATDAASAARPIQVPAWGNC